MISLIVAMAKNRVIGKKNTIPWHITEDYIRTRKLTKGHPIIMGQNNFESISGFSNFKGASGKKSSKVRILPDRTNIVLSFDKNYKVPGAIVCNSFEEGVAKAKESPGAEEIFVFGGASVYKYALDNDLVDRLYITLIDENIEGDVHFPEIDKKKWKKYSELKRVVRVGEKVIKYSFQKYRKKTS